MALIVTPGAPDANSYCSLAQAAAYHEGHLDQATWDDADPADQERALRQATRMLDVYVTWDGHAVSTSQALAWPRYGAYSRNGYLLPHTAIPTDVVNATAELARHLLATEPSSGEADTGAVTKIQAGPVVLEFGDRAPVGTIPESVAMLVRHLGTVSGTRGGGNVPVTRA